MKDRIYIELDRSEAEGVLWATEKAKTDPEFKAWPDLAADVIWLERAADKLRAALASESGEREDWPDEIFVGDHNGFLLVIKPTDSWTAAKRRYVPAPEGSERDG